MATQIKLRSPARNTGKPSSGFAGSVVLHVVAAGIVLGWAYLVHHGQNWGDSSSTGASIQATMVSSLPLPSKQPMNADNVLATDTPTPAPVTPAPQTVAAPKVDAIPIPTVHPKHTKIAEKTTPPPPLHPQPIKQQPDKAQTGEAPGIRIAMSSAQTQAGTVSVGTPDAAFGVHWAYYVRQITNKVAQQWYTGMLDPRASGHRVYITFQVERDGSPTDIRIAQPSGDATLDQTALSAVQHIDTFGPLPDGYTGSHINVTYYFDAPLHP